MKNKKLLLGIGALVLVLVGGLVANSSDLFQGKVRNRRSPQSIVIPSAPSPASSMTSSSSNSLPIAVDLKINGSDGPVVLPSYVEGLVASNIQGVSWTSTNATSCTASSGTSTPIQFWSGNKAVNGQQNVQAFPNAGVLENTLVLTCTNANGESASDSLRVIRGSAPTVDLLINGEEDDALVLPGEEVVLSWTSTNADSCSGWSNLPGWFVGTKPTNGSETFTMPNGAPETIPAYYRVAMLTCSSGGGVGINDSVGVYILSVDLKANGSNGPVTAPLGTGSAATGVGTVTLSWNAPNATACTASSSLETVGWTGSKSTSGNAVINVPSARQFSLQCLAPGLASVSDSVMVLFNPN